MGDTNTESLDLSKPERNFSELDLSELDLSALDLPALERDGFLAIPDFVSEASCLALRERALEIVANTDFAKIASVFSTTEKSHTQDDYFLDSASQVKCFLEKDAADAGGNLVADFAGGEKSSLDCAINKIGHAQHDLDNEFERFSYTPELAAVARAIGFEKPLLIQAMYIFKAPKTGGEVVAHTDHPFLWTEPQTVMGFWFAIDDATEENGCLWAMPGGHKTEPIRQRVKRDGTAEIFDDTPFDTSKFVPLPAKRGTLIILDGKLPHLSEHNHSDKSRHAYTLHIIEGDESKAKYLDDNWLQRSSDLPFRDLYEVVKSL